MRGKFKLIFTQVVEAGKVMAKNKATGFIILESYSLTHHAVLKIKKIYKTKGHIQRATMSMKNL